jgi:hypothetical protein
MAFYNEFLWGVDGLTTDDAQLTKNTVMDFNVDKVGANTMAPGNTMEIKAEITTYGRVTSQAEGVNVVWLTENMGASYDPATGIFTAGSAEGKVAFMLSYSAKLPNGKQYVLYSQPVTVDVVAEPVEDELNIVRKKSFYFKPMTREEAVMQMNLLGHNFFAFRDEDNGGTFAVVYKREDGGYGLIDDIP